MNATHAIDLNCDLGEGGGHDAELMRLVSSANVATGSHAGGGPLVEATVRQAIAHGVAVGAHPGHADREHFGRRELPLTPDQAATTIDAQIATVARVAGPALHHVKLHGGLYHQVGRDPVLAEAVAGMLAARWPGLFVYAAAGSRFAAVARAHGLDVVDEAFCDRRYRADGTLVPRGSPTACIDDAAAAADGAVRLAAQGSIRADDGSDLVLHAGTLCVHGDGPAAVAIARAVRRGLSAAGIRVRAPATGRARSM